MPGEIKNTFGKNINKKVENKNKKKMLENTLKQAFGMARDGQLTIIRDNGTQYILLREDKLQEAINNLQAGMGFTVDPPQEFKDFNKYHQEVLTVMSKLDYEELGRDQFDSDEDYELHRQIVERNANLFGEIDQFTFEMAEGYQKTKQYRKQVLDKYLNFRSEHPEIDEILSSKVEQKIG